MLAAVGDGDLAGRGGPARAGVALGEGGAERGDAVGLVAVATAERGQLVDVERERAGREPPRLGQGGDPEVDHAVER